LALPLLRHGRACPGHPDRDLRGVLHESASDPTETLAAKFAVMHNAVFPTTAW
jgi:hypothetical protein